MTDKVDNSNNLNAHYTTNAKVIRHPATVAAVPSSMPSNHVYNDIDASKRLSEINNDIYEKAQNEKKSPNKKFWKGYLTFVACILAFIGIKKFFK